MRRIAGCSLLDHRREGNILELIADTVKMELAQYKQGCMEG